LEASSRHPRPDPKFAILGNDMPRPAVWHQFVGTASGVAAKPLLDALSHAGMRLVAPSDDMPAHATGLIFFDTDSPALHERLREVSRGGLGRVIAIAVDQAAIGRDTSWRLVREGASDLLVWSQERNTAAEIVARVARWDEVDRCVESPMVRDNLVGTGHAWTLVARRLVEAARFADGPVLILGETGTGKELAARLIHALDTRQNKRGLIVVDCGAIAPELSGSELFGHVRGAFTGAVDAREGAFAIADGGTLFLDEIGELPLRLQPELLRAVQERTYKRLGSNVWRETSFRLVSATNRDLPREVEEGKFRSDLYYRLASVVVRLPPLRERAEDIVPLAQHFVGQMTRDGSTPPLDDTVREYLCRRSYPGNVRDLRQLVSRIMQRHVGPGPITVGDIPPDERPDVALPGDWRDETFERAVRRAVAQGAGMKEISHAATELAIEIAVEVEGNLQSAARRLGVTDRALQMRRAAKRQSPDPLAEL